MEPNTEKRSNEEEKLGPTGSEAAVTHRWTFLTNHAHVLIALQGNQHMILREVAVQVGITERAVQRIIQELEEERYIRRQKIGRKNQYEVLSDRPLRHPLECHRSIGDLLRLITKTEFKSTL
ncbi:MAG: winged helix-turn-helix transcriptional regulator [Pirellulaceae bacterium]|nr:winged helix-turn-helix transcriptional regulator [Pirellulaceae bacterium]